VIKPVPGAARDHDGGTMATAKKATAPVAKAPARSAATAAPAGAQADDWTADELAEVRAELEGQAVALRAEIDRAEAASESLKRDQSSEGSGDEADAGSKTFEREHEMSLSNNSRDLLVQVERALGRLDAGTYGRCEECGNAIPKARLQAFPRATLCVACKQREERR
jgi:DnaK suppressor protein